MYKTFNKFLCMPELMLFLANLYSRKIQLCNGASCDKPQAENAIHAMVVVAPHSVPFSSA